MKQVLNFHSIVLAQEEDHLQVFLEPEVEDLEEVLQEHQEVSKEVWEEEP